MLKEILRGVELFDGLSDDDLDQVAALCKERKIPRGELLVKEGDSGDELFIITDGFVEVLRHFVKSPQTIGLGIFY